MWSRFVAVGDSTVEGLDDPAPDGGYRGWADRLAEHAAHHDPELRYANLAGRGRRLGEVVDAQLPAALALRPDLVAAVAGVNDMLARSFSPVLVEAQLAHLHSSLREAGATDVTFTMPDPGGAMPLARLLRARLEELNGATRRAAAKHGVRCVDLARHPVARDPRPGSADRLHANSIGHTRIAAALAHALGLPGSDASWVEQLPPTAARPRAEVVTAELAWLRGHLLPWLVRRGRGRSSGDGLTAKRPALERLGGTDGG
jgi:lysophospholipase L1-like esterase